MPPFLFSSTIAQNAAIAKNMRKSAMNQKRTLNESIEIIVFHDGAGE
jgi:uncharacterized protein (UPF0147 family)